MPLAAAVALAVGGALLVGRAVTVGGAVVAKEGYESLIPLGMRWKLIDEPTHDLVDLLRLENRRQQIPGFEYRSPDPAHSFLHNRRRATRIRRRPRSWTREEAGLARVLALCHSPRIIIRSAKTEAALLHSHEIHHPSRRFTDPPSSPTTPRPRPRKDMTNARVFAHEPVTAHAPRPTMET